MTLGPIVAGCGLALLTRIDPGSTYVGEVLPGIVVFGLGLSLTVAPLTATVLAAVGDEHAGAASAINNDVARVAGLIAVAVLPQISGIASYRDPVVLASGFHMAVGITSAMCIAGGLVAFFTIRPVARPKQVASEYHCAIEATPLHTTSSVSASPGG